MSSPPNHAHSFWSLSSGLFAQRAWDHACRVTFHTWCSLISTSAHTGFDHRPKARLCVCTCGMEHFSRHYYLREVTQTLLIPGWHCLTSCVLKSQTEAENGTIEPLADIHFSENHDLIRSYSQNGWLIAAHINKENTSLVANDRNIT